MDRTNGRRTEPLSVDGRRVHESRFDGHRRNNEGEGVDVRLVNWGTGSEFRQGKRGRGSGGDRVRRGREETC